MQPDFLKCQWKLPDKTVFLLFFDKSTRTRNSFEAGCTQLGAHARVALRVEARDCTGVACGGGLRYCAAPPVGCADANRRGIRLSGHVHFPGANQRSCCDRYCRPALRADLAAGVDASSRLGWADATRRDDARVDRRKRGATPGGASSNRSGVHESATRPYASSSRSDGAVCARRASKSRVVQTSRDRVVVQHV